MNVQIKFFKTNIKIRKKNVCPTSLVAPKHLKLTLLTSNKLCITNCLYGTQCAYKGDMHLPIGKSKITTI